MKIKKAIVMNPPTGLFIRDDRCQAPAKWVSVLRMPLDLATIAATLRQADVEVRLVDYPAEQQTWEDLKEDIIKFKPDMVVISTTTPTIKNDLKVCKLVKNIDPDIVTVAKGAHVTIFDEKVMEEFPHLDICIRRESEIAAKEIVLKPWSDVLGLTFRKNGIVKRTPDRPFLKNLDELPFPARDLVNNKLYTRPDTGQPQTTIQSQRGCPARCIYCLVGAVSGYNINFRSPESVVEEIEECVNKYNIRDFYFRADTFTWDKEWTIKLCKLIVDKKMDIGWNCNSRVSTIDAERLEWMKKAGCWLIGFGVETGSNESLRKIKKGTTVEQAEVAIKLCKEYDMKSYLFFVIGLPWEKKEDVEATINFAKKLGGDFTEFNMAFPYPGTELYQIGIEQGLIREEDLYAGGTQHKSKLRTIFLSSEELDELRKKGEKGLLFSPSYIFRTISQIRSPKVFFNYMKYGTRLLVDLVQNKQ
ncbi:radical SAM protein [Candidatus Woesearchaeota archaeon]|nr:radical SAM protein [Candidatus Woesearchaeota archaeon]